MTLISAKPTKAGTAVVEVHEPKRIALITGPTRPVGRLATLAERKAAGMK